MGGPVDGLYVVLPQRCDVAVVPDVLFRVLRQAEAPDRLQVGQDVDYRGAVLDVADYGTISECLGVPAVEGLAEHFFRPAYAFVLFVREHAAREEVAVKPRYDTHADHVADELHRCELHLVEVVERALAA